MADQGFRRNLMILAPLRPGGQCGAWYGKGPGAGLRGLLTTRHSLLERTYISAPARFFSAMKCSYQNTSTGLAMNMDE